MCIRDRCLADCSEKGGRDQRPDEHLRDARGQLEAEGREDVYKRQLLLGEVASSEAMMTERFSPAGQALEKEQIMKLEKTPGGYALYKEKTIIGTCLLYTSVRGVATSQEKCLTRRLGR